MRWDHVVRREEHPLHSGARLSASLSAPLGLAWHAHRPTARSARSGSSLRPLPPLLTERSIACPWLCPMAHCWLFPGLSVGSYMARSTDCMAEWTIALYGALMGSYGLRRLQAASQRFRFALRLRHQSLCAWMIEDSLRCVCKPFLGDEPTASSKPSLALCSAI